MVEDIHDFFIQKQGILHLRLYRKNSIHLEFSLSTCNMDRFIITLNDALKGSITSGACMQDAKGMYQLCKAKYKDVLSIEWIRNKSGPFVLVDHSEHLLEIVGVLMVKRDNRKMSLMRDTLRKVSLRRKSRERIKIPQDELYHRVCDIAERYFAQSGKPNEELTTEIQDLVREIKQRLKK